MEAARPGSREPLTGFAETDRKASHSQAKMAPETELSRTFGRPGAIRRFLVSSTGIVWPATARALSPETPDRLIPHAPHPTTSLLGTLTLLTCQGAALGQDLVRETFSEGNLGPMAGQGGGLACRGRSGRRGRRLRDAPSRGEDAPATSRSRRT